MSKRRQRQYTPAEREQLERDRAREAYEAAMLEDAKREMFGDDADWLDDDVGAK